MERKPNVFGKWPTKLKEKRAPLVALAFSVLNFLLCCAFALSPLPTSLFASRQSVSAAPAIANLSGIMGYSQNGNSYNYVYFGEYPKTRVETTSETTIKGYIKTLNEYYYRTYLQDTSNPHHSMQDSSYVWTDETDNTTKVKNFW